MKLAVALQNNKKLRYALCGGILFAVVFLLLLPVFVPYWTTGKLALGSDYPYHLARIENIAMGLLGGQFPVRIHPDVIGGLGYANSLFYPELFFYLPAVLVLLGMSAKSAYLAFYVILFFGAGVIMFFFARKFFPNDWLALLAAVLFVSGQYFYMTAMFRAAVGELCGMVFTLVVLWGLHDYVKESFTKPWILLIGMTGLSYSHAISLALNGLFVAVIALCHPRLTFSKRYLIRIGVIVALWAGLSAGFFLPFFEQLATGDFYFSHTEHLGQNTEVDQNTYSLITMFYNGYLQRYSVGLPAVLCLFLRLLIAPTEENRAARKTLNRALLVLVVLILLPSRYVPWGLLKYTPLGMIQYPWRFLLLTTGILPLYILACLVEIAKSPRCLGRILQHRWVKRGICVLGAAVFCVYAGAFLPYEGAEFPEDTVTIGFGEWLPYSDFNEEESVSIYYYYTLAEEYPDVYAQTGEPVPFTRAEHSVTITFTAQSGGSYTLPLLLYRGYAAVGEHGEQFALSMARDNRIVVDVGDYSGEVTVFYAGTTVQTVSTVLSVLTLLGASAWAIWQFCRQRKRQGSD